MLDIGTIIKNKRLESSLTHEEISAALRIKIRLLIALEENNIQAFGSKSYYLGYLKQYIKFLDIADFETINNELSLQEKELAINIPSLNNPIPSLMLAITCFFIGIIIYFICDQYLSKGILFSL